MPLSKANYLAIVKTFEGLGTTDHTALKTYLTEKKKTALPASIIYEASKPAAVNNAVKQPFIKTTMPVCVKTVAAIQPINAPVLAATRQRLILKAYSPSTIKTYLNEISQLLQTIGKTSANSITVEQLKRYFAYCFEKLKLSENTLHSRINAIKFYYEQVLGRERFFWDIPRPKKPLLLPRLLNEEELRKLFNALINKKHNAMLFTAYSAGLRVSEIVNLKIADIDSKRMQIFVDRAKGKKTGT